MSTHDRLAYLRTSKANPCTRCALHKRGAQKVFQAGNPDAAITLIGSAPDIHDEAAGEPFAGSVGQLLEDMLARVGLTRDSVYLIHTVKCRPKHTPTPAEVSACAPFLHMQLAISRPRVVVALGEAAGRVLAQQGLSASIHFLRRHNWMYSNRTTGIEVPLLVSHHPADVLHAMKNKQRAKNIALETIADLNKAIKIAEGI